MTTIRPLRPDEAEAYVALRREMLHDAPWAFSASPLPNDDRACDAAHMRESLANPENVVVGAFAGGSLIASVGVMRSPRAKFRHTAHIWGVYVTPQHRGKGLAREVMLAAIGTARAWPGVVCVRLSASALSTTARALYESLGFVTWGIEPDYLRQPESPGEKGPDEHHMVLRF